VKVRFLEREDGALLIDLVHRLSSESRYHRFHIPMDFATDDDLRAQLPAYLDVDQRDHIALIALAEEENGQEAAIAVVRFKRGPQPDEAELAIVVRDDWQRLGIGVQLVIQAIDVARRVGIKRFLAWVQGTNRSAQRLVADLPYRIEHHPERGEDYIILHAD
jgi:acetyltransferase